MTDWIITLSLSTIMHAAVRSGSNSKYYVCITFWNAQYMSKVTPGSHLVASLPSNKSNISFSFFLLLKEFLKYEKNKINRGMYDSKNRISTNRIWSKTGDLASSAEARMYYFFKILWRLAIHAVNVGRIHT